MFRGGMTGTEGLVTALEGYYAQNNSWAGAETFFTRQAGGAMGGGMGAGGGRGQGMGMAAQRLRLAELSGKILADSAGTSVGVVVPRPELSSAIALHDSGGKVTGYLLVEGGIPVRQGDELPLISRLNDAALRSGLISLLIAVLVGLVLSAGLLRPIRQLTQAARRLASGDLGQKVPVKGRDELAILADSFNVMSASLQQSEDRRKAMTADIAHELRTPLSVQRAQLEALQDGIYPLQIENLQPILDQNALLNRLVDDLRTLALADAGELKLEKAEVEICELLEGLASQLQPAAAARGIHLEIEKGSDGKCPSLQVDPDRLAQIITNLVGNAIRHTQSQGTITLSLAWDRKRVNIMVRDTGPGIPPESLPFIFERFYRAEPSRSREVGGSGLGLAIARQLAQAHRGQLTAANHPSGGALFILSLPV
jgi:signal transduction histidine kinase